MSIDSASHRSGELPTQSFHPEGVGSSNSSVQEYGCKHGDHHGHCAEGEGINRYRLPRAQWKQPGSIVCDVEDVLNKAGYTLFAGKREKSLRSGRGEVR